MNIKDLIIRKSVGNLYWKDKEGRYGGCNNEFAEMIGLSSPEEIIGKTDRDLFLKSLGEEKLQKLLLHDQEIMREDQEKTIEEIGVDDQKRMAYYITRKSPLKDNQGQIIGLIGTSINITKEKGAMLAKQAFLENMSHDIRTPLAGVYGLAQILCDDYRDGNLDSETVTEMLGDIKQSAGTLLEFLDHVLKIVDVGKDPVKKEKVDIKALIDEVALMLLPAIKQKNLKIEMDSPEIFVYTDKSRLLRIVLNLVSNAIKFTSEGKIKIQTSLAKNLMIAVEDTGIGIPEEKLNEIFDQFYKIKPSNQLPEFTGCGLGLYIARTMAAEIGAEITVQSIVNQGSKFIVTLNEASIVQSRLNLAEVGERLTTST